MDFWASDRVFEEDELIASGRAVAHFQTDCSRFF